MVLLSSDRLLRRWWRRRDRRRPTAARPARGRRSQAAAACGSCTTAAERIGQRVEADAEQHAGEDQEQGGGKIPGEHQQCREQHDADAADGDRPGQIGAGFGRSSLEMVTSCPFRLPAGALFRQISPGIKPGPVRRFEAPAARQEPTPWTRSRCPERAHLRENSIAVPRSVLLQFVPSRRHVGEYFSAGRSERE